MDPSQRPDHDTAEQEAIATLLGSSCSPSEWAFFLTRIAEHEPRLQHLAPAARSDAVVEALLSDATTNPILAAALWKMRRSSIAQHLARDPQN